MSEIERVPITFDKNFVEQYARRLVKDPEIAIVELISNCSDAGANLVEIDWPTSQYENNDFSIKDDGTGMTYDEFANIWNTLSYNRREHGNNIVFPSDNTKSARKLFGKNGKGRFSLFCFDDDYMVETCKGGERCIFKVQRLPERRVEPIRIELHERVKDDASSHYTIISSCTFKNYVEVERLKDLIACKFLSDPNLKISVNGDPITLTNLEQENREIVETPMGDVEIYTLDSGRGGRTSHPHGVAWHVNGKGVGNVDWRDPNRLYTLDARTTEAKRFTIIVVADVLADFVNPDWTAFEDCDETDEVLEIVSMHIQAKLDDLFYEKRQERKQVAMQENDRDLKKLPSSSLKRINVYVDGIQKAVRTIDQNTLNAAVRFLTELEASSSGYKLLHELADVQPGDLDRLYKILKNWSLRDAEIVLDELGRRLRLIAKLEELVDQDVDELHVIHPLIDQGIWIFGPEYEGTSFTSNKGLRRVFKELLGDTKTFIDNPRLRPDIVTVAEVFSRDSHDKESGKVNGVDRVLIIELKRGGSEVGEAEMQEVMKYAHRIRKSGDLASEGRIEGLLLGSTLGDNTDEPLRYGDRVRIEAQTYQTMIKQAKARTFHLKRKIEEAKRSK